MKAARIWSYFKLLVLFDFRSKDIFVIFMFLKCAVVFVHWVILWGSFLVEFFYSRFLVVS